MSRRPSLTEVNGMKKEELKATLKDLLTELQAEGPREQADALDGEDVGNVTQLLTSILGEVKELRKEKSSLKAEIDALKQENSFLSSAINQHQRFLESIDAAKRSCNLIITGVPEDINITVPGSGSAPAVTADKDETKVSLILKQAIPNNDVTLVEVARLGKKRPAGGPGHRPPRPRPLKVVTSSAAERKLVLENSRNLKNAGQQFSRIYVNKDIHPLVRKELNRVRGVEKDERRKPENQGRTVNYDSDTRSVSVDGVVVDRFRPTFF